MPSNNTSRIVPIAFTAITCGVLVGGLGAGPASASSTAVNQPVSSSAAITGWVTPDQLGLGTGWRKTSSKPKGSRVTVLRMPRFACDPIPMEVAHADRLHR